MIVVIDPGHGGTKRVGGGSSQNNATGPDGTHEKDLTLDIGLRLEIAMKLRGHSVFLISAHDENFSLKNKVMVAKDKK